MAKSKANAEDSNYLKSARDLAFIVAIYLYYMGWIYIYFYLSSFNLSVKAIDADVYNFLIYSSDVFLYLYNHHLFVFIIIVLFPLLFFWEKTSHIFIKLSPFLIVLLFPLTFFVAKTAADYNANLAKHDPLTYLPRVKFIFKEGKPDTGEKKSKAIDSNLTDNNEERVNTLKWNRNGFYRLIAANKDDYYVLHTPDAKGSDSPQIYVIKKENVEFAQIIK